MRAAYTQDFHRFYLARFGFTHGCNVREKEYERTGLKLKTSRSARSFTKVNCLGLKCCKIEIEFSLGRR